MKHLFRCILAFLNKYFLQFLHNSDIYTGFGHPTRYLYQTSAFCNYLLLPFSLRRNRSSKWPQQRRTQRHSHWHHGLHRPGVMHWHWISSDVGGIWMGEQSGRCHQRHRPSWISRPSDSQHEHEMSNTGEGRVAFLANIQSITQDLFTVNHNSILLIGCMLWNGLFKICC